MAIKLSPGCGCCEPLSLSCCNVIIAKPYGTLSFVTGSASGNVSDISGVADTNFHADWDFSQASSYDTQDPNVLPANSEITFEVQSCCYDFHFEVEVFDFALNTTTPNANNPVLDIFSETMQSRIYDNGKTSLYSRANFASDLTTNLNDSGMFHSRTGQTRSKTYRAVQAASWIGTGSTCEEIYDFTVSKYRYESTYATTGNYAYDTATTLHGIRSCGKLPVNWGTTSSKSNRLTLKTHGIDVTIGGIMIRTGVNAQSNDGSGSTSISHWLGSGSTDGKQCVRIFGQSHTSSSPQREFGAQDYVSETQTSSTQSNSGLFGNGINGNEAHGSVPLVRKSGQVTKSSYAATTYEWTLNNTSFQGQPGYTPMTATASIELDHSVKNGSYDWVLHDNMDGVSSPLSTQEVSDWETWCENVATDNWQHKYSRPFYHNYSWKMPLICSVWPDPNNCATSGSTGFPHNDIRTECSSTHADATYTYTGTGTIDWFSTGTSLPCMFDTTPAFTNYENTFPYNTNGGWEPGNFTKPLYVDTTFGTTKSAPGLSYNSTTGNWVFGNSYNLISTESYPVDQIDPLNPSLFVEPVFGTWAHSWYQLDDEMEDRVIGMMLGDQYNANPSSGTPSGYNPSLRSVDGLLNFHFTEQSSSQSGNLTYSSVNTGSWSITAGWTGHTKIFWDIRKGKTQFDNCVARVGRGKTFDKSVTSLSITTEVRQLVGGIVTLTSTNTVSSTAASYDTNAVYGGVYRGTNPRTDGKFYLYDNFTNQFEEGHRWKDKCPSMQDIMIGSTEYRVTLSNSALGFWVWNKSTNDVYDPYDATSSHFSETVSGCGQRTIEFSTESDNVVGTRYVVEIQTIEAK